MYNEMLFCSAVDPLLATSKPVILDPDCFIKGSGKVQGSGKIIQSAGARMP